MAKTKISEFSATPANNTDIDSINIAEGCAPSGINDAIRELMAQLKDFQTGAVGDSFNGPVGTSTAAAGAFTTLSSTGNTTLGDASGDAVTINGTATFANANPTLTAGTANGVTYLNGSKVLTSGSALYFDGTKLGINTSSPVRTLSIANGGPVVEIDPAGGTAGPIYFNYNRSTATYLTPEYWALAHIWNVSGGTEAMRLTSTGLGIGTSSPSAKNHIRGSGTSGQVTASWILENASSGTSGMDITGSAGASRWRFLYTGAGPSTGTNTFSEAMSIGIEGASAGNLGIGTSSPSAKLDVAGSAYVRGDSTDATFTSAGQLAIKRSSSDPVLSFHANAGSQIGNIQMQASGTCSITVAVAQPLAFNVNGSERARIDASGNLLVGTTSATSSSRLRVKSSDDTDTTYTIYVDNSSATQLFSVISDGDFNTGQATHSPYNYTTANAANMVVESSGLVKRSTSSLKYKKNIADATHGLTDVLKLRSVTYEGKAESDAGKTFGGLIAEEVHAVGLTEFVQYAEDGTPDALAYGNMVSLCIKAIQEQQTIIESLKARLDAANL